MASAPVKGPGGRVVSIDALRGFDMFMIIGGDSLFRIVSTMIGGSFFMAVAAQFHHEEWNGFNFEDLIFPLFLFIVGMVMPFSITRRLERGDSRGAIYRHIVTRAVTLVFLGLLYNGLLNFDFSNFRYAGVLQRIALCSLFAGLIVMNTGIRGQIGWIVGILLGYWAAMMLIPVPGYGAGVLTPEGNLASWIDRLFLPGRFCCFRFGDNEGLLSTIPSVATTLLGVLAGHLLRREDLAKAKRAGMLATAGACGIIAGLIWDLVFPINKLIWTSSYVLFAGGLSALVAAAFYWVIDVKGYSKWAFFFIVIGLNPITIYVTQGLFDFGTVANIFLHGFIDNLGELKPLVWTSSVLAVKWLFLYFLYRQKIFLKV